MADRLDAARDAALRSIYLALGGDETLLVRKRSGSDPRLDFVLAEHALAVEVDEIQHFTSERLRTLDLYPPAAEVCFDTGAYRALIGRWCTTGDRYRAAKPSVDFPFAGGRRAQRAYFDAFRDLAAPSFRLCVLRIPAAATTRSVHKFGRGADLTDLKRDLVCGALRPSGDSLVLLTESHHGGSGRATVSSPTRKEAQNVRVEVRA